MNHRHKLIVALSLVLISVEICPQVSRTSGSERRPSALSPAQKLVLANSALAKIGSKIHATALSNAVSLGIDHGTAGEQAYLNLEGLVFEVHFLMKNAELNKSEGIDGKLPVKIEFQVPSDGMYFVDATVYCMGATKFFGKTTSYGQPTSRTTSDLINSDRHFGFAFEAKAGKKRTITIGANHGWTFYSSEISKVN